MISIDVARTAPGRTNTNTFDVRPLRVTLLDDFAQPLSGIRYAFTINGVVTEGTTDGDGAARAVALPGFKEAKLEYWPTPDDKEPEVLLLDIAEIPPANTAQGARVRLRAFGFDCDEDDEEFIEALRGFQEMVGLPMTGALDADTVTVLDELYGDPS